MAEQTVEMLASLNTALRQLTFYPSEHPLCAGAVQDAFQRTQTALKAEEWITVGLSGDTMISRGHPLVELGKRADTLCAALRSLDVSWFTFARGLACGELQQWLLHLRDASRRTNEATTKVWGGAAIRMGGGESSGETKASRRTPAESVVGEFSDWLRIGGTSGIEHIRNAMKVVAIELDSDELPLTIVEQALDAHQYGVQRGVLVSVMSMSLGKLAGMPSAALCDLGLAGLFCDIGLRSVSDQMLSSKHGDIMDSALWNDHPVEGARTLVRAEAPSIPVVAAAEHHWGLNYASPQRHPVSCIVGIADDVVGRILGGYGKPGHRLDTALIGLAREGTHYSVELVWQLFQMSGLFVGGTPVRLSNKKRATIERMNPRDPLRPRVFIDDAVDPASSCDLSELASGPVMTALVVE